VYLGSEAEAQQPLKPHGGRGKRRRRIERHAELEMCHHRVLCQLAPLVPDLGVHLRQDGVVRIMTACIFPSDLPEHERLHCTAAPTTTMSGNASCLPYG
jgi:hypothetical protein